MNFTKKSFSILFLTYILILGFNYFYRIYLDRNYENISFSLISKNSFFRDYFLLYVGIIITILFILYNVIEIKNLFFNVTKNTFFIISLVCLISFFFNVLEQINFYGLSKTPAITTNLWTDMDIKRKIVALPEYQGDSLIITNDGKIESKDALIQSYIHQMYTVPANLDGLTTIAKSKNEPTAVFIYLQSIVYYSQSHPEKVKNGESSKLAAVVTKLWTDKEIKRKILALPEYQGDSLVITTNGIIESKDALIQSYIHQMYTVPANFEGLTTIAKSKNEPTALYIYIQSISYYSQSHPDKVKIK